MEFEFVATIALGAFLGATISGLAGFAFGVSSLSIWAHFMGPELIAPMVVACSLAAQLMTLLMVWRHINWRTVWPFILGGLLGILPGSWLLSLLDRDTFRIAVGILLVTYVSVLAITRATPALAVRNRGANAIVGFGGGVMGGFAGLPGVLPTLWCSVLKWTKDEQRTTFQIYNLVMHVLALATYWGRDMIPVDFGPALLVALPAVVVGSLIGFRFYRRVDDAQFRRILIWLIGVSGVALIAPHLM